LFIKTGNLNQINSCLKTNILTTW